MNSKDFFEQFFKINTKHSYSQSLLLFFEEIVRPRLGGNQLNILDIGAGNYSLFEDVQKLNAKITAIDFSQNAIDFAPQSSISYLQGDITDATFFSTANYDLLFDSHCLNCLTTEEQRDLAFKNIYLALVTGGIFASEMMIQPIGAHVSMPFKMIKSALELEQEIISHGFKIVYFMISRDSSFAMMVDGVETKCDVLKIVAQK